jgi:RHS repeat-associated protein
VAQAGEQYDYDDAGNLTHGRESQTYGFDGENKMTSFNGGATQGGADYIYDGEGKRVKKVVGNVTTVFVYDVMGRLVAEYTSAIPEANGTTFFTSDHLESPRVITDSNGAVKARHDYHPFGEEVGLRGGRSTLNGYVADNVRQKFTFYERDIETQLDFAQARYYSNPQGRFTSVDPENAGAFQSDPQSWNGYAYARNNPLLYTDPDGLLFLIKRPDGSEEILTDKQFNDIKYNPNNRELGVVVKGGRIYNTDENGNLFVVATYERIWFDDLTDQANYAIFGIAARAPAMQTIILGFAAANLLPAAGIVGSMTLAGGGLTTLGLSGMAGEAAVASLAAQLKFTATVAARQALASRRVPLYTIAQAILSGQRMADPQNARGAVKIVHEMWKNGKKYQLEIIYREADKTILHVLYK